MAAGERPVEGEEFLGPKALATEAVMLGLRTTAGIDLDAFTARHGFDLLAANDALVARLVAEGHLVVQRRPGGGRRLVTTCPGWPWQTAWPPRSTSRSRATRPKDNTGRCADANRPSWPGRVTVRVTSRVASMT